MDNQQFRCNICSNNTFRVKKQITKSLGIYSGKFQVVKCRNCDLYSLHPTPSDSDFKLIYSGYADKGNRIDVEKKRLENIYPQKIELIKKYFDQKDIHILDIGAGIGGFVSVAKKNGYNITGIEFEQEQVALAKHHFNVDLLNTKYEDFVKTSNIKFDVIHLHHVLEHVQSPKTVINLIKSQLKDEGLLIFEVPNQFFVFPQFIWFKLGLIHYLKPYHPYHHLYFFSPKTIKILLRIAGLKILELNIKVKPKEKSLKSHLKYFIAASLNLATSGLIEVVAKKNEIR